MPAAGVLIVEDHPLFSKGLAALINSQAQFIVLGEAKNAEEAMELIVREKPALVIVDLNLGKDSGLDLIASIKNTWPGVFSLVLSMYDERYYAERALHAGARGYIMKTEAGNKVLDALKTIMSGKVYLSDSERDRIFERLTGDSGREGPDWFASIQKLSNRQFQVFSLIGRGFGTIEIASKLKLSTKTIDTHKEHIKLKLHCDNAQELRQMAVRWISSGKELI
jgi:DNA-binding NarL/FixJ family response regulator